MIRDRTTIRRPHRKVRTFTSPAGVVETNAPDDLRVSVEVWDEGYDLPVRLYFASTNPDAALAGVEVGGEAHPNGPLTAKHLGHVYRQLAIYEMYARAEIAAALDPAKGQELLDALSVTGMTRRGLSTAFYRMRPAG